ncbi:MAG: phosphoribosylanthranilate isomerase [bacterium]
MIRVKICGITNVEDAIYASKLGAHALGFIFYQGSKRYISPEEARAIIDKLPPFIVKVGVFVNEKESEILDIYNYLSLDRVQIHADFPVKYVNLPARNVIMAYRVKAKEDIDAAMCSEYFPLLDRYDEKEYGGTGKSFDWSLLNGIKRPYILAGGINLDNIERVFELKPYAIDISSGVEKEYGKKDYQKMFEIFSKLRENLML